MHNSGGSSVAPSDLKDKVSRTVSMFSGYGQQDAQEFMRFLLDRMHDELNRAKTKPAYKEIKVDHLPVAEQADRYAQYY